MFVFFFMAGAAYLTAALMGSAWTGARGLQVGAYLRASAGGAFVVPLLFFIYLCASRFAKGRIPRPFGQGMGTLLLYFSTAFVLGLFKEARWALPWLLADPGVVGDGLARFFMLNLGVLGSVFAAFAFLALSSIFYGFRLPLRLVRALADGLLNRNEEKRERTAGTAAPSPGGILLTESDVLDRPERAEAAPQEAPAPPKTAETEPDAGEPDMRESGAELRAAPEPVEFPGPVKFPEPVGFPETASSVPIELPEPVEFSESASPIKPADPVLPPILSSLPAALPDGEDGRASAVPEAFPEVRFAESSDEADGFRAGLFPPPLDIFGPSVRDDGEDGTRELADRQAGLIVETLQNFGVKASVAHIVIGPSVIQFQLELAPGIKVSKVSGLANDLTMALAVLSVRVEAPILGQRYVGIEIPNPRRRGITLRSIMESDEFQEGESALPLPMGVRVDSKHLVCGLEDMPHLLVAGTTGSGKSVFTNTCILGMCSQRSPEELRLILVDPKHVEFAIYEGLPHLLARPVSDPKKAVAALTWAVQEMESRSEAFASAKVRNLASYNEKVLPKHRFPHIVVVVDELADLMYTAGKEVESLIARLAQKARAAGIHLILATQRPSVDVITGLIKANVPARVAFAVPSQTDSRTIIDMGGAEKLLGKGDMLFYSTRYPRPLRLQASFVTEERTLEFVAYMKNVFGEPEYIEFEDLPNGVGAGTGAGENSGSVAADPKLEEAIRVIMNTGIASASGLQRRLSVGYPRAGKLISNLEELGIIGPQPASASKPREILMDEESALETLDRARAADA
ncbi:MAG: DNA translocase FtsK [Synergistaceae bacterium]|jgi:S-DNA-T family DNA segregation ATPase FtsK/SpoIIIE|nr:DNA translocase FtsK [Synergistaceae bacterium]